MPESLPVGRRHALRNPPVLSRGLAAPPPVGRSGEERGCSTAQPTALAVRVGHGSSVVSVPSLGPALLFQKPRRPLSGSPLHFHFLLF